MLTDRVSWRNRSFQHFGSIYHHVEKSQLTCINVGTIEAEWDSEIKWDQIEYSQLYFNQYLDFESQRLEHFSLRTRSSLITEVRIYSSSWESRKFKGQRTSLNVDRKIFKVFLCGSHANIKPSGLKDTHREKAPSNKTPGLQKVQIWTFGLLVQ